MNKHDYWKKRQTQLWNNLERDENVLKDKMAKCYEQELASLEKEIGSYFAKYGKNNVIQYRDLLQAVSDAERDKIYRNFEGFVENYPQYENLAQVRNSIYKLDRLQGLELSIKQQQLEIGAIEIDELTNHLAKTFKDNYQETAKVMGFTHDKLALQTIIDDDWINKSNFSESIWGNKDKLVNYLVNDFKSGIIRGDSFDKLMKQLRDRFSKQSNYNLSRLLTTEGTYVANQAMMKPFEDSGLYDEYEFVAVIDSHTSSICKGLDGEKFKIESKQVGVNFPPMHANCRSTFAMVIPDDLEQKVEAKNTKEDFSILDEIKNSGILEEDERYSQQIKKINDDYNAFFKESKAKRDANASIYRQGKQTFEQYKENDTKILAERSAYGNNIRDKLVPIKEKQIINARDKMRDIFAQYRNFGFVDVSPTDVFEKPNTKASKLLRKSLEYIPSDWIKNSAEHSVTHGKIETKIVTRGYHVGKTIALSGSDDNQIILTGIHEFIHETEHTRKGFSNIEKEFFEKRTIGEQIESLRKTSSGIGYNKDEVTKKDHFIDPYMGKVYKESSDGTQAYELATMGIEELYRAPAEFYKKDPEMFEWVAELLKNG